MKKLLVVLLTVVMILSLAAIASAEVSTWIGGDFYFRYHSVDKAWEPGFNNFFVGSITAKATKDNTWAKLFINLDTWQSFNKSTLGVSEATLGVDLNGDGDTLDTINVVTDSGPAGGIFYALGMDKIGGIASVSFSTKDQDLCNIGQAPLMDSFDDFKTDPVFNTYDGNNSMGLVMDTDAFTFKAETVVSANTRPNMFAINAIIKFEGGKAYLAYKGESPWGPEGNKLMDLGGEMKLGEMALKADVWMYAVGSTAGNNIIQANVNGGAWDATLSVLLPPGGGNTTIGVGGNYRLDKLTVGAKYENDTDAVYEVYGLYNVGAFDLRAGYVDPGAGDGYVTVGVHAGIW